MKEDSWRYVQSGRDVLDPESGTGSKGVMGCIHDPGSIDDRAHRMFLFELLYLTSHTVNNILNNEEP